MKIPFIKKSQLLLVKIIINIQNFILNILRDLLFSKLKSRPQNILIFKVGNIGDVVCAIPAFIAVRKAFPEAKLILLTSPGKKGSLAAKELLNNAWYLDELKVYYSEDIASLRYRKNLMKELKNKKIDLFIQIPDDWTNFKTLFRNLIFAKLIGARSAFGFQLRTILNLFRKTQIDYLLNQNEVQFLLDLLKSNEIPAEKAEFSLVVPQEAGEKVKNLIQEKLGDINRSLIIGICPGGKGEEKHWPPEKFAAVGKYFEKKYNAKFVIIGGGDYDASAAEIIEKSISANNVCNAVNKLEIIESVAILEKCSFLLSNDTGVMHLAAALNKPVVALFSIRNTLGKWFPYGNQHKILYHRFLNCDYRKKECVKKSMEMISVEEVVSACEELIQEQKLAY